MDFRLKPVFSFDKLKHKLELKSSKKKNNNNNKIKMTILLILKELLQKFYDFKKSNINKNEYFQAIF
jgi:hypothetical protein